MSMFSSRQGQSQQFLSQSALSLNQHMPDEPPLHSVHRQRPKHPTSIVHQDSKYRACQMFWTLFLLSLEYLRCSRIIRLEAMMIIDKYVPGGGSLTAINCGSFVQSIQLQLLRFCTASCYRSILITDEVCDLLKCFI